MKIRVFFQVMNKCSPNGRKTENLPVQETSCQSDQVNVQSKENNSRPGSNLGYWLRQRGSAETSITGNRIVDIKAMTETINSLYWAHNNSKWKCKNLNIEINKKTTHGLAWKFQFRCKRYGFVSDLYRTYAVTQNSKRSAAINANLAVALMDIFMGIARARLLFTALDIAPPTKSHMQKLTDKVSEAIVDLNRNDMSEKLNIVEQHNIEACHRNPKHIDVSMDGRYNLRGFKSSYKPGQN